MYLNFREFMVKYTYRKLLIKSIVNRLRDYRCITLFILGRETKESKTSLQLYKRSKKCNQIILTLTQPSEAYGIHTFCKRPANETNVRRTK
ncbi:jg21686 [Pararge aegeria aegeria]|uniref:Jg21686 protein n=1 Tax=Pararge aegeria aegeria TaxID=348720 RepID=A0A8S4R6L8_9NEOP|nr:jg21686 [Pararge aegeria aegeria]